MFVDWMLLVPGVQGWYVWSYGGVSKPLVFLHTVLVALELLCA
jgi:hypothetical protein